MTSENDKTGQKKANYIWRNILIMLSVIVLFSLGTMSVLYLYETFSESKLNISPKQRPVFDNVSDIALNKMKTKEKFGSIVTEVEGLLKNSHLFDAGDLTLVASTIFSGTIENLRSRLDDQDKDLEAELFTNDQGKIDPGLRKEFERYMDKVVAVQSANRYAIDWDPVERNRYLFVIENLYDRKIVDKSTLQDIVTIHSTVGREKFFGGSFTGISYMFILRFQFFIIVILFVISVGTNFGKIKKVFSSIYLAIMSIFSN